MGIRQDLALLISDDLTAVLADVRYALDIIHILDVAPEARAPLERAYKALAGKEWQPPI